MASQELLLLDAGEGLLGESSGSLFDCLDYDTGVDDLLSDGRRGNQFSSPMPSHLMQTFAVSFAARLSADLRDVMSLLLAPMLPEGVGSKRFLVAALAALTLLRMPLCCETTNGRLHAQVCCTAQT